jgi:hypothetical protein
MTEQFVNHVENKEQSIYPDVLLKDELMSVHHETNQLLMDCNELYAKYFK